VGDTRGSREQKLWAPLLTERQELTVVRETELFQIKKIASLWTKLNMYKQQKDG
jgi:hypothetical protein